MSFPIIILIIVLLIGVYYFFIMPSSKPPVSQPLVSKAAVPPPPPQPTAWVCINGVNVPIRKNAAGDIECMATNGKDCMWQSDATGCSKILTHSAESIKPLVCGEMHKSFYGDTGYDSTNPNHWCRIGKKSII